MVICLEQGAYLHIAQLMPLPLTISCSSKIQISFTFVVLAHLSSPRQMAVKRLCVCVCACMRACVFWENGGHVEYIFTWLSSRFAGGQG